MIDVEAVRLDADGDDLGAKLPERFRRDLVGGAVSAVDHDAQSLEAHVAGQGALGEFDIARAHVVDAAGAAEFRGRGELARQIAVDEFLDLLFDLVGELVTVRTEKLDAVVLEGIMRGGDHDADVGAHRARQHGDGGRRHGAEQQRVHADGSEAGDQSIFNHIAGKTRVLADDDAMATFAAVKNQPGGLADFKRELGRDFLIGETANAIGSEIGARHEFFPASRSRRVATPKPAPISA